MLNLYVKKSINYKYLRIVSTIFGIFSMSTSVLAVDLTPDIQLHGYATAGLNMLSNNQDNSYPDPKLTRAPIMQSGVSSEYDSVVGLQLKYRLDDQISFTTQMYVAAEDTPKTSYVPRVNWAYLDYKFNDEWTLRTGRFAFSTYLWSENVRVGAAYPWAHLSPEIYGQLGGLYSVNGVALLYKRPLGDWLLRVQPSFDEENLNGYAVKNFKQLAVSLSNEDLTLHAGSGFADVALDPFLRATLTKNIDRVLVGRYGYTPSQIDQYNASLQSSVRLNKRRAQFSDTGFIYDNGRWFAAGEMAALRFSGFVRDYNSGYASVGYHYGKWLPYVLYSRYKEINLDELDEIPAPGNAIFRKLVNLDERTISVGTRYQLKDNVCLKFQADQVSGFKGNFRSGFFLPPPSQAATPSTLKSTYIYSVSMNMAF
ncbi:MAG: hypothetical protein NVS3B3_11750 [Aquirhabdus sp.]